MTIPPTELLRELVHSAIVPNADPAADQNVWNIARQCVQTVLDNGYGPLSGAPVLDEAAIAQNRVAPILGDITAILNSANVPPADSLQQRISNLAYSARKTDADANDDRRRKTEAEKKLEITYKLLRDLAHALSPKHPIKAEALVDLAGGIMNELFLLREEVAEKSQSVQENSERLRTLLDPDGRFEDTSLTSLVEERMTELLSLRDKQAQQGTLFEEASAERMRTLLKARDGETLAAAAIRQVSLAEYDGYEKSLKEALREHRDFEAEIRKLVGAQDEYEDDDHYAPTQPTLDAVARIVDQLSRVDTYADGSHRSRDVVLARAQGSWPHQLADVKSEAEEEAWGRFQPVIWDNSNTQNLQYGVMDNQAGDWVEKARNGVSYEDAAKQCRAWEVIS
jgi:hypothetical protein